MTCTHFVKHLAGLDKRIADLTLLLGATGFPTILVHRPGHREAAAGLRFTVTQEYLGALGGLCSVLSTPDFSL